MDYATAVSPNSDDMDALFDSIVRNDATVALAAVPPPVADPTLDQDDGSDVAEKLLCQVGQLTRALHESLRALGYDQIIEKTAAAIPDARDRLAYVVTMTEQAADKTLNATDMVKPIQDAMAETSTALSERWDRLFARELSIEQFKELVAETRGFLGGVPAQAATTNAHLMEIMMAQDFQDLTGQVIKKTTEIIQTLEQELVQLLLDNIPQERRSEVTSSMMNGPVINATGRSDVVTGQNQVDDLLESLGF